MIASRLFINVSPLEKRSFFQSIQAASFLDAEEIPAWIAAAYFLHQTLRRAVFISPEARQLLLAELLPALRETAAAWDSGPPPPGAFTLAAYDARYATWTGKTGFLDLRTGGAVPALVGPPANVLLWDLSVIFVRRLKEPADEQLAANLDSA